MLSKQAAELPSERISQLLREPCGDRLLFNQPLSRYTASRIGGPADVLFEAGSSEELAGVLTICWQEEIPVYILGGGSNVLISDKGIRGLVIINRARGIEFMLENEPKTVWAETGANLGMVARLAASKGLSGLEWASGIPGTLGGGIAGNAGAHGGDIASNLHLAEILHHKGLEKPAEVARETWGAGDFHFEYRSSIIKRSLGEYAVLSAWLTVQQSDEKTVQARMDELKAYRKKTQPPGASMGSMFKNPPGDFAGRLIEAAGLKGTRTGGVQISTIHANFFINESNAKASDVYDLVCLARDRVHVAFGVDLELEVELVGEW